MIYLVVWALCTFVLYGALYALFNSDQTPRILPFLGQVSGFGAGWCIAELIKTDPFYWWLLAPTLAPVVWLVYKEYRKYRKANEHRTIR